MFTVLCGHCHSPGIYRHAANLVVYTAKAKYGIPDLAGTLDLKNKSISAFDHNGKNLVSDFKIRTNSGA
jgi:hypothetical protein